MPSVDARDQVFATLDPTMRQIALPSGANAILSDTVGFITDLPTSLVAAFRATLEEVLSADLIVHVRDISHPDTEAQKRDVETVLTELGVDAADRAARVIEAWNKIDLLTAGAAGRAVGGGRRQRGRQPALRRARAPGWRRCWRPSTGGWRRIGPWSSSTSTTTRASCVAWLHRHGEVLERTDDGTGLHLKVAIAAPERAQLAHKLGRPV